MIAVRSARRRCRSHDRVAGPGAAVASACASGRGRSGDFGFSTESKTPCAYLSQSVSYFTVPPRAHPCAYLKSQDVKDMYGESVQRSGHRTSSSADHVQ